MSASKFFITHLPSRLHYQSFYLLTWEHWYKHVLGYCLAHNQWSQKAAPKELCRLTVFFHIEKFVYTHKYK